MLKRPFILLAAALCALSCSTTRVLSESQYRLAENKVVIVDDADLRTAVLTPYIQQKANNSFFGWNPRLYIYNWADASKGDPAETIWGKLGEAPVVFDSDLVSTSAYKIKSHLRYLGYYDAEVEPEVQYKKNTAKVTYNVKAGKQLQVDSIVFNMPADSAFREAFAADSVSSLIKKGEALSADLVTKEASRAAAFYRNRGYYNLTTNSFSFVADTISVPGSVILTYGIDADAARIYKIGSVNVNLPEDVRFRESVAKGMNLLDPSSVYSERRVSNTLSRYSSIGMFSSVNVDTHEGEKPGTVDCDIFLSPSKIQGFKLTFELSTNSSGLMGVSPQVNVFHKNVFGGGERLNIGFTGNYQFMFGSDTHATEHGISAGLSVPRFLGLPYSFFRGPSMPRTDFNLSYNYQSRPEFTRNVLSGSFGYTGTYRRLLTYQVYPLQISYVRLFDLQDSFAQTLDRNPFMKYSYMDHFDAGLGGMLYYSTNNDAVPKTSYWYTRLGFDLSGNLISLLGTSTIWGAPYTQYAKGELQLGRTLRFGYDDAHSLAFRLLGGIGYAYGNSTTMPYEKQFYCGGASSMRGWQARALGPGPVPVNTYFSIPSQTGDVKLEADVEYRFPVMSIVEGALFAELGNVWALNSEIPEAIFKFNSFYKSLAADWGLGVRLNLDFILLRLDLGFKLLDPAGSATSGVFCGPSTWFTRDGFALHLAVGYPF